MCPILGSICSLHLSLYDTYTDLRNSPTSDTGWIRMSKEGSESERLNEYLHSTNGI